LFTSSDGCLPNTGARKGEVSVALGVCNGHRDWSSRVPCSWHYDLRDGDNHCVDGLAIDRCPKARVSMETLAPLLPSLVIILLPLIPVLYILRRVGMSLAWALLTLFPFFGLVVVLWVIAFRRWKPEAT